MREERKEKIALADWWDMREERKEKIVLWRLVEYEGGEELKIKIVLWRLVEYEGGEERKDSPLEIGGRRGEKR